MLMRNSASGFTLVELMIAITLGIASISAIMFFYLSTLTSSYSTLKTSRLHQEAASLMTLMINDLRRAGIGGQAFNSITVSAGATNAYSFDPQTTLTIYSSSSSSALFMPPSQAADCVLLSYDVDNNLTFDENTEVFGYRLNDAKEVQLFVPAKNALTDFPDTCPDDGWESLTDADQMIVSELVFSIDAYCVNANEPNGEDDLGDADSDIDNDDEYNCDTFSGSSSVDIQTGESGVWIREVNIDLSMYLTDDPSVKLSLNQSVKIRNHLKVSLL